MGTGIPRREFLHSDDMAEAGPFLMSMNESGFSSLVTHAALPPLINIGCGTDLSIRELAQMIAGAVGFDGDLRFDTSMPDGTPRKLLDVSRIFTLDWRPVVDLASGVAKAYEDFLAFRIRSVDV